MKALITGAGGFTGYYLAAELASAGHEVTGTFSREAEGVPPGVNSAPVCDLLDSRRLAELVRDVKPDIVAHLAAISFVGHGDVEAIYRTNVLGTRNLLEAIAALETPPRMTLVASSANVYGNADVEVIDEFTPAAPANDYAVSKLAMEYVAKLYAHRLPLVIARPFNYTGVGQSESFLLPKIVSHARRRAPVIELGNLDVARDFSDVRIVVQYYRKLLECPQAAGKTFNVCSGEAYTLGDVLSMVQELAGHRFDIRVNPAFVRANEVKILRGSRAALDKLVGRIETIPLRDTLRWMLESPQ